MTAPYATGKDLSDLILRLAGTDGFAEAAALVLTEVVAPAGVQRALVFAPADGDLQAAGAIGFAPPDGFVGLRVASDALSFPDPLGSAEPAVLTGGDIGLAGEQANDRFTALPLPGGQPVGSWLGVLAVDADRSAARLDELAARVRALGPILARVHEVERLRHGTRNLQSQRELLTSIVNSLPDPVLITDAANRIVMENHRAETLLTTSEADSEGRRRAVEINNLLLSSFLSRGAGSGSGGRELNLVDPSEGGDLLFEVISTPLPATLYSGSTTVSVLREVTDLKRAATELERQFQRVRQAELKSRRERDRLNLVLETVGDPILVTDDQANIILMNREAERLFEVAAGTELRDRRRQDVRANDTKFSSFISDLALSPDASRIAEMQLADPDSGETFPAEVVSGKIFNERAEMAAIVSIVHDQTKVVENEKLAEELAKLNEGLEDRVSAATTELEERNRELVWQRQELERAYQLKSEFLASMSHELRTPINALLGYASLMRDRIYGELTPRQEEALQRMYAASQHLLELVNDVLDLAKIEAGKMPVHLERVDLDLLAREISLTIEPMVQRKNLDFRVSIEPSLPSVETDRTKVKQILLNLLSNAVKFTHSGRIELTLRRTDDGSGVELTVADTGIGIEPEDMSKIFEDFRQVDQSSTREYGGTGLGLSITRKLLALLGGTIRVDSCVGKGSTFTVSLPPRSRAVPNEEHALRAAADSGRTVVESGGGDDNG